MRNGSTADSMGISEDGRRRRTTSGPQKATQLSYQDTLQYYPLGIPQGVNPGSLRSGSSLPAGAMVPSATSHPASPTGSIQSAANGYHPYRRTPKGSESSSPTYLNPSGPPILPPMPGQPPQAALAMPPQSQRIRAASIASTGAAKEATRTIAATSSPPGSYSSAVSGMARPQQSTPQVGLSHLRSSPQARPMPPTSSQQRPELTNRTDSNHSDRTAAAVTAAAVAMGAAVVVPSSRPFHTRSESNSSTHSATDASQTLSTSSSIANLSSKKPSPLSKGSVADNQDNEAVYGGSDDENSTIRGRSTPTPGDKFKKGLSSKLRKALSFSTLNEIQQAEAAAAVPDRAYGGRNNLAYKRVEMTSSGETNGSSGSTRSTSPPRTPDNGAAPAMSASSAASISSRRSTRPPLSGSDGPKRSLFNRKFNSSTDNISISSTVSSASVMLRKVGNLGKIARRSSLMGLTNMFNKDKEHGKEGMHGDDFGTVPPGNLVAADDAALGAKGKKEKVKAKKGIPAMASVSHATVELESNSSMVDSSMTPAASYVRQHQLQMRQQAEADRIAKEKAEAEKLAAAQRNAKVTEDVMESRQKMIEKEKERLKSKRGWRKKLGVGSLGSTSEAKQVTGLETIPMDENAQEVPSSSSIPLSASVGPTGSSAAYQNENSPDTTFDEDELEPPHMPGAMEGYEGSGDEFETDSLRHWGEGIERSRESASKIRNVKGILKNRPSFHENTSQSNSASISASSSFDRPFANRLRANSYDAPQAASTHPGGSVPLMSQISTTSAATDRVDGVSRASTSEDDKGRGSLERNNAISPSSTISSSTSFGHHANSSMPTLSMMMHPSPTGQRSATSPNARKRIIFADAHIYHSTWPAHVYDRRGELATCNRLTPLLAQRIKEELNTYKMEEMAVAPSSRIHTHFFV